MLRREREREEGGCESAVSIDEFLHPEGTFENKKIDGRNVASNMIL